MKTLLTLCALGITVLCALSLAACSSSSSGNIRPTASSPDLSIPIVEAWVNLFNECPDAPDYGEITVDSAPVWRDSDWTILATSLPHGTKVFLLTRSPDSRGAYKIRSTMSPDGYLAASLLSDYDPANGVQPNESECAN